MFFLALFTDIRQQVFSKQILLFFLNRFCLLSSRFFLGCFQRNRVFIYLDFGSRFFHFRFRLHNFWWRWDLWFFYRFGFWNWLYRWFFMRQNFTLCSIAQHHGTNHIMLI